MKSFVYVVFVLFLSLVIAGCSSSPTDQEGEDVDNENIGEEEREEAEVLFENEQKAIETDGEKVIQLEAAETQWMFNDKLMEDVWVYNGSLPGEEIRVQEGDQVKVKFKNSLDEPTSVHFHGIPLSNEMDGVPGVTQNAVMPGEEFVYEFKADKPGSYWYHSHQNGANQVENGLYGALIVEPKDSESYDLDQVILIDEYASMEMDMDHGNMETEGHGSDHNGMNHGGHGEGDMDANGEAISHQEMMNQMYDTLLVNGKAAQAIEAIDVEEGDQIKLRFINSGLFTQVVSIPEHSYKVTHYDGQEVNVPESIEDQAIRVAPAERYDVEITMDQPGAWGIQIFAEDNREQLQTILPIIYDGYEDEELSMEDSIDSFFDLTNYGTPKEAEYGEITKEFDMSLGTNDGGETFTINGKQMSSEDIDGQERYVVEAGDVVKITIDNDTKADHPMHLHGHFFSVISRNGEPISGSPIMKDTLNVRPDESYEIVFKADNPGDWLFHCHELHHASGGMVAELKYKGFEPSFTPDANIPNKPE